MPQWIECTLNDIGEIVGGATPATAMKKYYGGKIPWITPKDLSSHQERYIAKGERNITSAGLNSCSTRLLPKNTILFTSRAPIGYIAISSTELCTNQGFKSIIPKEGIDKLFVYYLLIYNRNKIISMGSGTTFKEISGKVMKSIDVKIPQTIQHQRKIASILGRIDDKIELNNKINDNLQQHLNLLFFQIFTNIIPDIALGEVVETTSGGTPSRKHKEYYENGSICWIKSKELLGSYIHDTEEHINDLALSKSSTKMLPEHSVLIAMYGATVGAYGIISKQMTCNQAICALLSNENYPYTYLFQIAHEQQQNLINMAVGSAQQNISQALVKQLYIHSDIDAIKKFHKLAQPLHQQIQCLERENKTLSEVRDTLLPKLMSGELDVSELDI